MFEYLFNNDTQEIGNRVCELAKADEPVLREHCMEVSRQTDTSSLTASAACAANAAAVRAVLDAMGDAAKELSRVLSSGTDIFGVDNGKANFSTVCRVTVLIEQERQRLLSCIAALTQTRRTIAEDVAKTNRILHFLSLAKRAVSGDVCEPYLQAITLAEAAYARLTKCDSAVCELQKFCMTFVESQLSVFFKEFRTAADFNHAGEALDKQRIRALCNDLLMLINRCPKITF